MKIDNSKESLKEILKKAKKGDKLFFPFYSHILPKSVWNNYECIMFHMTDLPYGRGGTPLQNLIVRGFKKTKITAFRCNEIVDGGDVYLKKPLSLEGSAGEIYARATKIINLMIKEINSKRMKPKPQRGKVVKFKRRNWEQSNLKNVPLEKLYDHIRMLDADGYPRAFLIVKDKLIMFRDAREIGGELYCHCRIV